MKAAGNQNHTVSMLIPTLTTRAPLSEVFTFIDLTASLLRKLCAKWHFLHNYFAR